MAESRRRASDGLEGLEGLPNSADGLDQTDLFEPVMFHPSFSGTWQVSAEVGAIELQDEQPVNPDILERALDAAQRLTLSQESSSDISFLQSNKKFKEKQLLLGGQVIAGKAYGKLWVQTSKGFFPRVRTTNGANAFAAKPFWPSFRVVGKTHGESKGVAPYVYPTPEVQSGYKSPEDASGVLPAFEDYNPTSPLRVESLTRVIGYVFEEEEKPIPGLDANASEWWTNDGSNWWPKRVPREEMFGVPLPGKVCCFNVPGKTVTAPSVTMLSAYIKVGFEGRGYLLIAVILTEYLMIVVGAVAGARVGWTLGLQLIYFAALIVLALCEVVFIAVLVPNGTTWLRLNTTKCFLAVATSALWRWDLYGDVGFAVLAYLQRERLSLPLWIGSTAISVFVIGGRLLYSYYYIRILSKRVDERNLAQVSIPSFMNVIRDLCRSIDSDEGAEARRVSVRSELWFEILRTFCEDLPEIGIQAAYLFGSDAPPACSGCSYGFVFASFVASILTTVPGFSRIYGASRRYMYVNEEISSRGVESEMKNSVKENAVKEQLKSPGQSVEFVA